MISVDELKIKFGVNEDKELADKLGRTPGAVSNWRKLGIPANIERMANMLLDAQNKPHVSEPEILYKSTEELTLDEVEKMLIKKFRQKGKAYQFLKLAEMAAEEEADGMSASAEVISGG